MLGLFVFAGAWFIADAIETGLNKIASAIKEKEKD